MNKFLLFFLLISSVCFGSGYDLYINPPTGVQYNSFTPLNDGGFVLCGSIKRTLTSEATSFYFSRYDSTGNLSWTSQFYDTLLFNSLGQDQCYASEIVSTSNGDLIFIGTISKSQSIYADCFVGKLDANGNLINSKYYSGEVYAAGKEIKKGSDSTFVFAYHDYEGAGTGFEGLVKIDENLNEIWQSSYGYGVRIPHGLSVGPDNNIYSFADILYSYVSVYTNAPSCFTFDLSGNLSTLFISGFDSTPTFSLPFDYETTRAITGTFNHGAFITGVKSFSGNENISLMYIDSLGDSLWTRYYGNNLIDAANDIIFSPDSSYVLTGTNGDPCVPSFSRIFLMKIDINADSVWTKSFKGTINNTGTIVQSTLEGGYMIFGRSDSIVRIIKTNSDGDIISPYSISNSQSCGLNCMGDTVLLSVNQPANAYHWSNGDTLNSLQLLNSGLYSVNVTDASGVNYPLFSPYVSILPFPSTTFPSDTLHFCDSLRVSSSSSQIPGYSFQWFRNDTLIQLATNPTYLIQNNAKYKVIVSSICGTDTAGFVGMMHQRPAPPDVLPLNSVPCAGDSTRIYTTSNAINYQWYSNYTNIIPGATNVDYYPIVMAGNYGIYSVVITDSFGCTNTSSYSYVFPRRQINNIPINNLSPMSCLGDTVNLRVNVLYDTYTWNTGDTTKNLSITQPGYFYVILDAGRTCESYTDTIYVDYFPLVPLNLGTDTTTCVGTLLTVIAGPSNSIYLYQWQDSTSGNFFNVNSAQADTLQLYVQMTDSTTRCKSSDSLIVFVDNCLGENYLTKKEFSLSPNPSHDYFKIHGSIKPGTKLKLSGADGKLIFDRTISNEESEIDISSLPAGIYFAILGNEWFSILVKE